MPIATADALDAPYDVCVVGAGPAGLACALGAQARGLKVLLLDAGGERPTPGRPDILAAHISAPEWHDPTDIVSAAALGGTSHWWGGRAVPFDPVDLESWPLSYDDLAPWYEDAGAFLGARGVHDDPAPGAFAKLQRFDATRDETWCAEINMAKRWRAALRGADGPTIVLNARVVALDLGEREIRGVTVRIGDATRTAHARHVVLACGGLGGLRLLLLAQRDAPALFGGPDGPLGRGYMGHLTGAIADLALADRTDIDAFGFRPLGGDVYARRRIHARAETVRDTGIGHIAFWLDSGANEDPAHGSSVSSARYVAARMVRALRGGGGADQPLKPHLENIARAPVTAAAGLVRAAYLLAMTRLTGRLPRARRFTQANDGAWHMRYHAEQRPDPSNRISLSATEFDSIGLPRLQIDFRFSDAEIESVVRAHELLDADLRQAGAGGLRWRGERDACARMVADFARDGYHQIGGAVMSADPARGVVDADLRVHGFSNLWIASSSTFPTGSHANPTLTIVALARRLAAKLASAAA